MSKSRDSDTNAFYQAVQRNFSPDDMSEQNLVDFMHGGRSKAKELSQTKEIYDAIESLQISKSNKSKIASLADEARSLKVHSERVTRLADQKLDEIKVLEVKIESAKEDYKSAQTIEQLDRAVETLSQLDPKALGGIKSGESRRRRAAFESLFENQ